MASLVTTLTETTSKLVCVTTRLDSMEFEWELYRDENEPNIPRQRNNANGLDDELVYLAMKSFIHKVRYGRKAPAIGIAIGFQ